MKFIRRGIYLDSVDGKWTITKSTLKNIKYYTLYNKYTNQNVLDKFGQVRWWINLYDVKNYIETMRYKYMEMDKDFYNSETNEWLDYDDYKPLINNIIEKFNPEKIEINLYEESNISWGIWITFERYNPDKKIKKDFESLRLNHYWNFFEHRKEIYEDVYYIRDYLKKTYKNIQITTDLRKLT